MTNVYQRGQLIELNDGRQASVKFVGQTSFAPGDWIGVVLDEPNGKNDGSVQGQRYFQCDPLYGMFVRPSGISRILEDPTPKATKPKAPANGKAKGPSAATTAKGRPSSVMGNGLKRPLTGDPTSVKRQSLNAASPTPNPRALNGFKVSFLVFQASIGVLLNVDVVSYQAWTARFFQCLKCCIFQRGHARKLKQKIDSSTSSEDQCAAIEPGRRQRTTSRDNISFGLNESPSTTIYCGCGQRKGAWNRSWKVNIYSEPGVAAGPIDKA